MSCFCLVVVLLYKAKNYFNLVSETLVAVKGFLVKDNVIISRDGYLVTVQ